MFGQIFKVWTTFILLFSATPTFANETYFIQFDTVLVTMKVSKCHFWSTMSQCVYMPDAILKKFKPKKILKTNVPKFQQWQRYHQGYFFKVVKC